MVGTGSITWWSSDTPARIQRWDWDQCFWVLFGWLDHFRRSNPENHCTNTRPTPASQCRSWEYMKFRFCWAEECPDAHLAIIDNQCNILTSKAPGEKGFWVDGPKARLLGGSGRVITFLRTLIYISKCPQFQGPNMDGIFSNPANTSQLSGVIPRRKFHLCRLEPRQLLSFRKDRPTFTYSALE